MNGIGVSSRMRAEAGTCGLKDARNGFAGFSPTMSGISLGGFNVSMFAIRFVSPPEQWPNESRGWRPRSHSQDPAIKQERCGGEGDAPDEDPNGFIAEPDQRERRPFPGENDDRRDHYADNAFADN